MQDDPKTKLRWTPRVPLWFVFSLLVVAGGGVYWKMQLAGAPGEPPAALHPAGASETPGDTEAGSGGGTPGVAVRPSPLAGTWYEAGRDGLHEQVRGFLAGADPYHGARPLGLVSPHAGYRYSGAVAAWSYGALEKERYDRIFVLGPSHRYPLEGIGIGPWTHYETPLGRIPIDAAAVARLTADDRFAVVDGVDADEHSVEMQVPFLQVIAMGSAIVPMVVGRLDRDGVRHVAEVLRREVGPGDLVVVSTDFCHWGARFGYTPDVGDDRAAGIEALDMGAFDAFAAGGLDAFLDYKDETGITVCGYLPMAILQAMLPDTRAIELLRRDTSGAMTGDWNNSVSYVAAVATGDPWTGRGGDQSTWRFDRDEQLTLLTLARDSIEAHLDGRDAPPFDDYAITDEMRLPAGGFVTLTIDGHLRGCIGEIPSTRPVHEVVRDHAQDAAFRDPRFQSLEREELDRIAIEVSVLTPPRQVAGSEEIVLGRDGVYLIKGLRRAVYLPQVAVEQGWDLDETLSSLSRKAGLPPDAWKDGATFETFQAQVFHE